MKRRKFLKTTGTIISTSLLSELNFMNCSSQKKSKPNILWISCEDIRVQLHAGQILVVIDKKAQLAIPQMREVIKRVEGMQDHGWYLREAMTYLLDRIA